MDDINLKILDLLQNNGRMTNAELAEKAGLSPASTLERVRKLERNGVIQRYTAVVDPAKLGRGTLIFVTVTLAQHSLEVIERFKEAVDRLPEIMACYHITGEGDYLLKVLVRDMNAYEDFLLHGLMEIRQVGKLKSHVVMSTVKRSYNVPVGPAFGEE